MRLDIDHRRKLELGKLSDGSLAIDVGYLSHALERLNPFQQGLLFEALARADASKRKTPEQHVILALFLRNPDQEEGDDYAQ